MGKDMTCIAILNTVVIQTTGVILRASCCICPHIQVGRCDGHFGAFYNWIIIMQLISVDTNTPTTCLCAKFAKTNKNKLLTKGIK
jgi:hypothetical protein